MKPVMFFDFDDMLMETREASIDYIRFRYKVAFPEEAYLCGNSLWQILSELLPAGEKLEKDNFYLDWRDNFLTSIDRHQKAKPVAGAVEVVPALSAQFDLWVVTARQEASKPVVLELCRRFFGQHITGVHFVWRGGDESKSWVSVPKKDFIANFPGESVAFFDDNPGEIMETQGVVSAYLFDQTGIHASVQGINNRVKSWEEIGQLFL
ncbi:MAG: hypothetical protein WCP24_02925 [bacterium]